MVLELLKYMPLSVLVEGETSFSYIFLYYTSFFRLPMMAIIRFWLEVIIQLCWLGCKQGYISGYGESLWKILQL